MHTMPNFNPLDWITTNEAAELTGYTSSYFRKAIRRGVLKGVKRGGIWFLDKDEVQAYHEQMQRLGAAKHDPRRHGVQEHYG